ncbi:MAG: type II toxin-antitoxin system RelE/ParE family toxin [Nanoarchaeota archaeon]
MVCWTVLLSVDVQNFLDKSDNQISKRLKKGLEKLKCENPFHFLEHYEGENYYKYRIGDYRALIDVDFSNKILKVQVLDHRSVVYLK